MKFLYASHIRLIILTIILTSFEIIAIPTLHAFESSKVLNLKIDTVIVEKNKRKLYLYSNGKLFKKYSIALGFSPVGHKVMEGDGKTPEGEYVICSKNAKSKFGLSLKISYPNAKDVKVAKQMGVSPGGDIMIHGAPNKYSTIVKIPGVNWFMQQFDWSRGCISVTRKDMEEIYQLISTGTVIVIKP